MNTGDPRATHLFDDCSEFEPRVDQAQLAGTVTRFWSDLQGSGEGSMRLISGFLIGPRLHGIIRRSFSIPGEREAAGAWVAKEASLGRDVYMKPIVNGIKGGKVPVWAVGAEVDRSRLAILPRPSVSLNVTANRVQCYWRLDYPISSVEAEKLVRRLMWSQERPMMLPGMPDNRSFGAGKFECPECLPLTYSYDDLVHGFPHLKTTGPSWEPGILRPVDLLAQRAGVITAIFGGGALRAGMASAAAAVAAIGGFLIPSPLSGDAPRTNSIGASELSSPGQPAGTSAEPGIRSVLTSKEAIASTAPGFAASRTENHSKIREVLAETTDEGREQVQDVRETDEVGTAIGSGGELTREMFDRTTDSLPGQES